MVGRHALRPTTGSGGSLGIFLSVKTWLDAVLPSDRSVRISFMETRTVRELPRLAANSELVDYLLGEYRYGRFPCGLCFEPVHEPFVWPPRGEKSCFISIE